MSSNLLLPNKYKRIGWSILIPAIILGIISIITDFESFPVKTKVFALINGAFPEKNQYFTFINTNITITVIGILFIIGALLVGFSKEEKEDEFIAKLRLSSMLWAVIVNYILLLLSFIFVYGDAFLQVMLYNLFTVMIIFIARFNYILYRSSKSVYDEK
ncbi:MAG: hypothetical protein ABI237_04680 [Ginsengibacter sp.]